MSRPESTRRPGCAGWAWTCWVLAAIFPACTHPHRAWHTCGPADDGVVMINLARTCSAKRSSVEELPRVVSGQVVPGTTWPVWATNLEFYEECDSTDCVAEGGVLEIEQFEHGREVRGRWRLFWSDGSEDVGDIDASWCHRQDAMCP